MLLIIIGFCKIKKNIELTEFTAKFTLICSSAHGSTGPYYTVRKLPERQTGTKDKGGKAANITAQLITTIFLNKYTVARKYLDIMHFE